MKRTKERPENCSDKLRERGSGVRKCKSRDLVIRIIRG